MVRAFKAKGVEPSVSAPRSGFGVSGLITV